MENIREGELEFTYNLGSDFKIDIEAAKKRVQENKEEKQEESKGKHMSPVLTDYLIGLSKQNNNIDQRSENDAVKLFRPINF